MFSFLLPECAKRVIKTVFVVWSGAASAVSVSQVPLVHSRVFSSSLNEPSVKKITLKIAIIIVAANLLYVCHIHTLLHFL